jgi:multiple sugar transport system permease protein
MVLYLYRKGFEHLRFGYASALAWLLFFIILVFTMMIVRSSQSWVYYEGELKK